MRVEMQNLQSGWKSKDRQSSRNVPRRQRPGCLTRQARHTPGYSTGTIMRIVRITVVVGVKQTTCTKETELRRQDPLTAAPAQLRGT